MKEGWVAGRKQHYIPQFLLRNFGQKSGKTFKVAVYSKQRGIYTPATEGVGAERDFYSDPPTADGEITLDDKITEHELGVAEFLENIRRNKSNDVLNSSLSAKCISHFLIRTSHVREVFNEAVKTILRRGVDEGLSNDGLKKAMALGNTVPNKLIRDLLRKLWKENEKSLKANGVKQSDFERQAYRKLQEEGEGKLLENAPMVREIFGSFAERSSEIARKSHLEALNRTLAPMPRAQELEKMTWRILETDGGECLLPDYLVVAETRGGEILPAFFATQSEIKRIVLPISDRHLLIGGDVFSKDREIAAFFEGSIETCWEFFISNDRDRFGKYRENIGKGIGKLLPIDG